MAGQVSQAESQVIYRRLTQVAVQMLGLNEEIERLISLNQSVDLGANLEAESGGNLTVVQATTFVGEMIKYRDFFANVASVSSTGAADSGDRRASLDPLILAEPLV